MIGGPAKWRSLESTRPGRGALQVKGHTGISCPRCFSSPIFLGPMSIGIDLNSFERNSTIDTTT